MSELIVDKTTGNDNRFTILEKWQSQFDMASSDHQQLNGFKTCLWTWNLVDWGCEIYS